MKRPLLLLLLAAALALGGTIGFFAWRARVMARQITLRETALRRALAEGHGRDALVLVENVRQEAAGRASEEQQAAWQQAELRASVETRDVRRLLALFERSASLVMGDEDASLLAARALNAAGRPEAAVRVREAWRGKGRQVASWLAYDADLLLRGGQTEEALALLRSTKFEGPDDCPRLLRLAMLSMRQPEAALKYLSEAYQADPRNADLRTYRGQLLERAGQDALARVEYTAALLTAPANPLLRDGLAEFYLRQRDYPMAVQTWAGGQAQEGGDAHHFKALFWGLVTTPEKLTTSTPAAAGALQPLSALLEALPADRFWTEEEFAKLRTARAYESSRQEVFWLRLLQHLRDGEEKEAAEMLSSNRFRNGLYEPELAQALTAVLRYRLSGSAPPLDAFGPVTRERHPFLQQLADWSKGEAAPGLEEFVAGPQAFSGVFLALGWLEPAVRLAGLEKGLGAAPEWYRYGLVQAVRINRTPAAALALAQAQPPTPLLTLATGELQLGLGQEAAATHALSAVARDDSDAGYRAAWLLATRALEKKDFAGARAVVQAQGRLAAAVTGRELLARAAEQEGHPEAAAAQYLAVAETSTEAKAFLARRAFAAKNWNDARRFTEELLAQNPDELQLRRNLELIDQAAR